jgi:hypothetical protein
LERLFFSLCIGRSRFKFFKIQRIEQRDILMVIANQVDLFLNFNQVYAFILGYGKPVSELD